MAEKKTIELEVKSNLDSAERSVGSLKSQLRQAQAEVAALSDKFGATSKEAVAAAKSAAILKDKIADAKNLTDAFNPDAKFKSLSASLAGVAGGFAAYQGALGLVGVESKELEQQLLKVQSAMAIAEGLQGLGEAQDSFKQLKAVGVNAFNSIKTAIGSTGIGLIVVAAGAIYAYWDDIKGAVSGVSEEQKKLNSLSQENADQEEEKLKSLNTQDNVLKLQGKSEKEILNIKIKATNEAISAAKINIKNQEITNALAVQGAKRNYEYLKSFIDFISIPQRMIFESGAKAINKMIDLINKIPGVEIKGKIDETFANKASEYITKLAFDPEETKSKGEETIKAAKDSINKMVNDRAGMQLAINEIDKKAADDSKKNTNEKAKEKADALKAFNDDVLKNQQQMNVDKVNSEIQDKLDEKTSQEERLNDITTFVDGVEEQNQRNADTTKFINDKIAQDEIDTQKRKYEALSLVTQGGMNLLAALQDAGIAKGKAGQMAMKALTLVQIGIDTASAFSNAVPMAIKAGAEAAKLAGPGAPIVGPLATAASYLSSATMIASNIAKAKKLLSSGGSATPSTSGGGGGGGGTAAAPAAPSFNVVGASATNQLAQTIGNQQQQPIKTYVVAGDISTAQSLERNIISSASIG